MCALKLSIMRKRRAAETSGPLCKAGTREYPCLSGWNTVTSIPTLFQSGLSSQVLMSTVFQALYWMLGTFLGEWDKVPALGSSLVSQRGPSMSNGQWVRWESKRKKVHAISGLSEKKKESS